jgi:hypothetical protein
MYVHREPVLTTVKAGQDEANKAYITILLYTGICYEFFTILTSTTLAAKTTDA